MSIVKNNKNYGTVVKLMGEGPDPILEHIDITSNGDYTPREGTDGWNSIHVDVPTSGDPSLIRSLIDKSIESYSDPELQVIGAHAFGDCHRLTTVNCPKVKRVEYQGIAYAGNEAAGGGCDLTLDWDNLEYLGESSIAQSRITEFVTNASVVINNGSVFRHCENLMTFNAPNARLEHDGDTRSLFQYTALRDTGGVKHLFRNVRIGDNTFHTCGSLREVDLEDILHIGYRSFYNCKNLETVRLTASPTRHIEWLFDNAFGECSSLKTVVIEGYVGSIGYGIFSQCSSLESLTLTNSGTIERLTAFRPDPNDFFGDGCNPNVNIYVPAEDVDRLKEAWSDRADHIFAIN